MTRKLSYEEIRQVEFIRSFDDAFIDSWSLDRDILSLTILDDCVRYRVVSMVSSFVARWFVQVWSVKIAKHCPSAKPITNSYCGYDLCSPHDFDYDYVKNHEFSYSDNMINEVSLSDFCEQGSSTMR